jgi:protein gp37
MSDLFHKAVSYDFISKSFDVMCQASHHRFQVLTKRSSRLLQLNADLPWPENVWMGVTIENNDYVYRADDLRTVNAAVRFLSLEPLLGPLPDLRLEGIGWVIVGGESGPKARPMLLKWVLDIKKRCEIEGGVPFFFKQWGGINRKKTGRLLLGKTWDNYPKTAGGPRSCFRPPPRLSTQVEAAGKKAQGVA